MTKKQMHAGESLWQLYDERLAHGHYSASQVAAVLVELGLALSAEEWQVQREASGSGDASGKLWVLTPCVSLDDSGPRLILDLGEEHGGLGVYQPLRAPRHGTNRYYREAA